jgi:hypothetical protein
MENLIYNGMTIEEIKNNLPKNMTSSHKKMYLNNCEEVYFNEKHGINLGLCQAIRNSNFNLIKIYNRL